VRRSLFGAELCNLAKPLHNLFARKQCNRAYKHSLDELLKQQTKRVEKRAAGHVIPASDGESNLTSVVMTAIERTVPPDILDEELSPQR
jgi:hypothetical protein